MDARGQRQPKRWTQEEDAILYEEAIKQASLGPVKDWHRIAAKIPNRTNKDCRKRWVNKVRGGLRSGPWSEAEDQKLRESVEKYGQRWTVISQEFGSRSSDQCAKRWQYTLDPKLEHRQWSSGEDHLLLELVHKFGHDWKFICYQHYPTRSRNDVKNRYTILSRRLASGSAETDVGDDDVHDYGHMGEVHAPDSPELLGAGALGAPSGTEFDITLHDGFTFNSLEGHGHGCESIAGSDGCTGPTFFDGIDALLGGASSEPNAAGDDPAWMIHQSINDTHGEFSPCADDTSGAMGLYNDGYDGNQSMTDAPSLDVGTPADFSLSQALNSLECSSTSIQSIEKLDMSNATPYTGVDDECDPLSTSFKVVLMAEECDHELVKYLIDVTKPIQGRIKMKVVM